MRINLPVTADEHEFPEHDMLVSTTDVRAHITHCNEAFVRASGFDYHELVGQPHNLIRHPDMPAEAFKDLWVQIGRGHGWTGLIKNRRKDGSFYWVRANVTPIMENGKPAGYMSVRVKPSRNEVQAAEALYAQMRSDAAQGRKGVRLVAGRVRYPGLRGLLQRVYALSPTSTLALLMVATAALAALPVGFGFSRVTALALSFVLLSVGLAGILLWFWRGLARPIRSAERFASELAACNLRTSFDMEAFPPPLAGLARNLNQIQVNLQAVVGDVRTEIIAVRQATAEIAAGGHDLSARTEAQASNVEQTAAAMEELSSTVQHTADAAVQVSRDSAESANVARKGGDAVQEVGVAMRAIENSSRQVGDIVSMIEALAFQTNLLALNAAVEAARAGEQGRGFAVVAGEVRALSQRSSQAAKDIRALIATSVSQVEAGSKQMNEAGETIAAVVTSVSKVNDRVRQISEATREQSIGIAQANEAVTQLENMTQQNAALVEETAASAQMLEGRTEALSRAVEVFQMA